MWAKSSTNSKIPTNYHKDSALSSNAIFVWNATNEDCWADDIGSDEWLLQEIISSRFCFYGGLVFTSQENEVIEVSIEHRICEKELKSIFFFLCKTCKWLWCYITLIASVVNDNVHVMQYKYTQNNLSDIFS